MFIVLGLVTVVIGFCTFFFLPDTPMKARWLSDNEKVALLKHVSVNQTGIESRKFRPKQILEALTDPQIYLLVLSVILVSDTFRQQAHSILFFTSTCFSRNIVSTRVWLIHPSLNSFRCPVASSLPTRQRSSGIWVTIPNKQP
jgi:hypothetical protein